MQSIYISVTMLHNKAMLFVVTTQKDQKRKYEWKIPSCGAHALLDLLRACQSYCLGSTLSDTDDTADTFVSSAVEGDELQVTCNLSTEY